MRKHIKEITTDSVVKITSGQVITDLASSVKELVENSVDANASMIEIRFRNYGIDAIEVIDNGDGVSKEDLEGIGNLHNLLSYFNFYGTSNKISSIGRRYYTSKLRSYEDLLVVETFGFRGEAISSLCSLAEVQVITCTKEDAPLATKLIFDSKGDIKFKTISSGRKGTHISILELFGKLPVRRKDFVRNSKREFSKAVSLLQAYAIICVNVKINVSHTFGPSKKKSILFSTTGKGNLKSNVSSIYGLSVFDSLIPLKIFFEMTQSSIVQPKKPMTDTGNLENFTVSIEGYISKPIFGHGRTTSDRQLFYVNNRPCNLPQVAKAFNEIYKNFNSAQFPILIANIKMDTSKYDVNVSPDKRTILLHNEEVLIELLKKNISTVFEKTEHSIPRNLNKIVKTESIFDNIQKAISNKAYPVAVVEKDDEKIEFQNVGIIGDARVPLSQKRKPIMNSYAFSNSGSLNSINNINKNEASLVSRDFNIETVRIFSKNSDIESELDEEKDKSAQSIPKPNIESNDIYHNDSIICAKKGDKNLILSFDSVEKKGSALEKLETSVDQGEKFTERVSKLDLSNVLTESLIHLNKNTELPQIPAQKSKYNEGFFSSSGTRSQYKYRTYTYDMQIYFKQKKLQRGINEVLGLRRIANQISKQAPNKKKGMHKRKKFCKKHPISINSLLSEVMISDINQEETLVESMLNLTIHKQDFLNMEIVGQFNLGFILATNYNHCTKKKDLFIIDQHASDEIFNFERLQKETVIQNQPLVVPLILDLTAMEELTLISNIQTFQANGFKFKIDEKALPGKKCKLISVPVSKSTTFDIGDIQELIYLLDTHTGKIGIRCSKLRSMLAMRACRSSIMIGKPLALTTMRRVLTNLSTLNRPWNCPHGRPTMRHLCNIGEFIGSFDDYI